MKPNEDHILDQLVRSTRSPRGRFSAEESWKLLKQKIHARRKRRVLWLRAASAAAVVLLCVTGWAAYRIWAPAFRSPEPPAQTQPAAVQETEASPLVFRQMPLQQIAEELSERFGVNIRIEDEGLKQYRMTATFGPDETLEEILQLLDNAGQFGHTYTGDTIVITKLN